MSAPAKSSRISTWPRNGALLPACPLSPPSGRLRRALFWIESAAQDFIRSRDHGLANIDALAAEWSTRIPISEQTIRSYLTANIHYVLDEECVEGMQGFFRMAAECGVLPPYTLALDEMAAR